MKYLSRPIPVLGGIHMKHLFILCLISCPLLASEAQPRSKEAKKSYNLDLKKIELSTPDAYEILYYQNLLLQEGELYLVPFSLSKKTFAH